LGFLVRKIFIWQPWFRRADKQGDQRSLIKYCPKCQN
jgi:hypothetical protein